MPTKTAHKTDKETAKDENDPQPTEAQKNAILPVDTGETRSFQTGAGPDGRENLTKDEARARGFHWLDTDEKSKGKKG